MNINCTCKYLFATANKTYLHLQIFNCKKQRLSEIKFTEEYLRELGLNERQIKAVMYVKEKGKITNKEYRTINGVSDETARLELNDLVKKEIFTSKGKGRSVKYVFK